MNTIAEIELVRARWRRALAHEGLDTTARDDFALSGLAARLRAPSARLMALPGDPEADSLPVDDALWAWLQGYRTIDIGGGSVRLGTQQMPTAHAAALVDSTGDGQTWTSYVAIHRSGAVEYGLGDRGASERTDADDQPMRVFKLISIVAHTWALLNFTVALHERFPPKPAGPYRLVVALQRTRGSFLGNLGEGWDEAISWGDPLPRCADEHLLWHIDLDQWRDNASAQDIAFAVGDRVEHAWGDRERRFRAARPTCRTARHPPPPPLGVAGGRRYCVPT